MENRLFLECNNDPLEKLLLLNKNEESEFHVPSAGSVNPQPKAIKVNPLVGLSVKCKDESGLKYFINICTVKEIPPPEEKSEDELVKMLLEEEQISYRIPLSIGEAHLEKDNKGNQCSVYDILINPKFFKKILSSKIFEEFFISLCFQSLEDKYNITLDKNAWVILKNKPYFGRMPNHYIQNRLVQEVGVPQPNFSSTESSSISSGNMDSPLIKEVKSHYYDQIEKSNVMFEYALLQHTEKGSAITVYSMIHIPLKVDHNSLDLSMNEDTILLTEKQQVRVNISLPMKVDAQNSVVQYCKLDQVLLIKSNVIR